MKTTLINIFLSYIAAATESMLLRIQSSWVALLVCCWESGTRRFEGTRVRRNDSNHPPNNSACKARRPTSSEQHCDTLQSRDYDSAWCHMQPTEISEPLL